MAKCGILGYLWCNLTRFFLAKPPLTVIFIFIGTLALCFYTLSYYVQSYEIVDEESTSKLSDILDSLLRLSFCLSNNTIQLNTTSIGTNIKSFGHAEFVNLSFPLLASFSITNNFFQKYQQISEVDGLLPYFLLHKDDNHLHSIYLQASLTDMLTHNTCSDMNCDIETCVTIQVKKDFAPYKSPYESCIGRESLANQTIFMHHLKGQKNERSLCPSPDLQLNFKKKDKSYIPYVYLSMWLKSKVDMRLHIASYIFFVLLLSFVIYATMKGRAMHTVAPLKDVES